MTDVMEFMPKPKKYSSKRILIKAIYSSAIGFPISYGLNMGLLNWIAYVIHHFYWLFAAGIIGLPFFCTSAARQFLIDFVYQRYGKLIDPIHLIDYVRLRYHEKRFEEKVNGN